MGVLAIHLRNGGDPLNKEKYEKPEITTEILEPNALVALCGSGSFKNSVMNNSYPFPPPDDGCWTWIGTGVQAGH
jgi:hypothetical protein